MDIWRSTFVLLLSVVLLFEIVVCQDLIQMQFAYGRDARDTKSCDIICTTARPRAVCGTDGRTYPHKCQIRKLRQCEGVKVKVASRGRCPRSGVLHITAPQPLKADAPPESKCLEERRYALKETGTFAPECREDGSFAEAQCHDDKISGLFCWCVTESGKPIRGTSVRGKNIRCQRAKGCNVQDRAKFNNNLVTLFFEEYARVSDPGLNDDTVETDKRVISWKFNELNSNNDELLQMKEVRTLKNMVKKLVKPKTCAKTFDSYCDLDGDDAITRREWAVCLGVEKNNDTSPTPMPGLLPLPPPPPAESTTRNKKERRPSSGVIQGDLTADLGRHLPLAPADDEDEDEQVLSVTDSGLSHFLRTTAETISTKKDCRSARIEATENSLLRPGDRLFVPECSVADDTMYELAQCHELESKSYCWCVSAKTGRPISGTATQDNMPDCNNIKPKDFKGCSYAKKKKFLVELIDQMTKERMQDAENGVEDDNTPDDPEHSFEERVARWKLRVLDKNRSGVLERREWKVYRTSIQKLKNLRKCGRNFLRYCDADDDKKISMDEWLECMGINEKGGNIEINRKRIGPNPFKKYLKSSS